MKLPEELQQLLETVTDCMETAASTADHSTAKHNLLKRMERLREGLVVSASADGGSDTSKRENTHMKSKCR